MIQPGFDDGIYPIKALFLGVTLKQILSVSLVQKGWNDYNECILGLHRQTPKCYRIADHYATHLWRRQDHPLSLPDTAPTKALQEAIKRETTIKRETIQLC